MSDVNQEDRLVSHLLKLDKNEKPRVLAALRSGLGKRPGEAPRMFPYVTRYIQSSNTTAPSVQTAFLIAALYAKHPEHSSRVSLGLALWKATKRDENPEGKHGLPGVEARFVAMLDTHEEDLQRHLEGLISLLESAGVGLDWFQLKFDVYDLLNVDDDKRKTDVHVKWARDFWQGPARETNQTSNENNEGLTK